MKFSSAKGVLNTLDVGPVVRGPKPGCVATSSEDDVVAIPVGHCW